MWTTTSWSCLFPLRFFCNLSIMYFSPDTRRQCLMKNLHSQRNTCRLFWMVNLLRLLHTYDFCFLRAVSCSGLHHLRRCHHPNFSDDKYGFEWWTFWRFLEMATHLLCSILSGYKAAFSVGIQFNKPLYFLLLWLQIKLTTLGFELVAFQTCCP